MKYPRVLIDLAKLKKNALTILSWANKHNIKLAYVNKCVCGNEAIANELLPLGFSYLADSRIENLIDIKTDKEKMLLRIGSIANASDVVKYSDLSLQSSIEVIEALNKEAKILNKIHKIILMIDLGDLREGIFYKDVNLIDTCVEKVLKMHHISLAGIGTNLTCYGSIVPTKENLGELLSLKAYIESKFGVKLDIVSGGNSSSLYLVKDNNIPDGINNLRIGEAVLLGTDTAKGIKFDELYDDAFILETELCEVFSKPSFPIGERSVNAFGEVEEYEDRGIMIRGIAAIGRQDVADDMIVPLDESVEIIGSSSDHLILKLPSEYKVGSIVRFKLKYGSLLRAFTSSYIKKEFVK